uniref:MFS domain-containing protein n=1 Tax=Caenorhabditis japonica TaxID=281687 RepID=A0A8R1DKC6_CAEJA
MRTRKKVKMMYPFWTKMLKSSKSISVEDLHSISEFSDEHCHQKTPKKAPGRTRWYICAIVTGLLTLLQANVHVYNFTVLCMQEEQALLTKAQENGSANSNTNSTNLAENFFNYDKLEQDLLFSAAYIAPLPSTVILYFLTNRSGVKTTLMICAVISFLSTFLTPAATHYGFWFLWTARFFQGLPAAILSIVVSIVTSHWSTLPENGVYVSILAAHYQIAPLLTMPLSALMCSVGGWSSVYYTQGAITAIFIVLFAIFYTDKPSDNKFVGRAELKAIESGKSLEEKHVEKSKTPWVAIHKDTSVWAIWLTSVGGTIGFSIFLQYGPTYLNKVLHYNLSTTGWTAAIPYIFSCVARIAAQPLSANCSFLGERLAAIVSTTISQGTMAICFLVLMLIPQDWSSVGQLCYSLVIVANGLNGVGITRSAQLVCKQHLSFVYTARSFYNFTVGLLLPILVSFVAPNDTHREWTTLFLIIFCIVFVSNLIFIIFARAEAAPWTVGTAEIDDRSENDMEEQKGQKIVEKF